MSAIQGREMDPRSGDPADFGILPGEDIDMNEKNEHEFIKVEGGLTLNAAH